MIHMFGGKDKSCAPEGVAGSTRLSEYNGSIYTSV